MTSQNFSDTEEYLQREMDECDKCIALRKARKDDACSFHRGEARYLAGFEAGKKAGFNDGKRYGHFEHFVENNNCPTCKKNVDEIQEKARHDTFRKVTNWLLVNGWDLENFNKWLESQELEALKKHVEKAGEAEGIISGNEKPLKETSNSFPASKNRKEAKS